MTVLDSKAINEQLKEIPNWTFSDGFLSTQIVCSNFKEAFGLMTRIAFEAEALGHHPNWDNVYNTINIKLRTHDANGITTADFALARQIESLRD